MNVYEKKENCCGCTACLNICPKSAIEMVTDEKGFKYPLVKSDYCIGCNLCKKVCDFQSGDTVNNIDLDDNLIYGVKHKNFDERITSRSGGVFMALCDYVLSKKGVIYGATFDDKLKVIHKCAETKEEVNKFKGSKYVQSDLGMVFGQIKDELNSSRTVLFSGTACQTAGLRKYIKLCKVNSDNLILCDLVCHGVPSPLFFEKYLDFLSSKTGRSVTEFNFRDKYFGWAPHIESFFSNKRYYSNLYTDLFYKHIMFRPSCENCKYTNFNRPSDLTIADFWGVNKAIDNFDDNKGVSLLIINTHKGKEIFETIKDKLEYSLSDKNSCIQPNLQHPSIFSDKCDEFWNDFQSKGVEYVMKKYGNMNFKEQVKFKIKVILHQLNLRKM